MGERGKKGEMGKMEKMVKCSLSACGAQTVVVAL